MNTPPNSICILRLSAIGEVTHMIPVIHTVQKHWPSTHITWVIGKKEVNLVEDFSNIEFVVFDKSKAISSYRSIASVMKNKHFDVLICAQVSLRANFLSTLIPAKLKLGYDTARSKDFHTIFMDDSIAAKIGQHVLDSFFEFIEHLGLKERELVWNYIIPKEAEEFANQHIDPSRKNIIISPCSSHPKRNWRSERYAAVADFAVLSLNANVILCGGPSETEIKVGNEIESQMHSKITNLIGKDSLKKFLALLKHTDVIITPDSGPAHMAAGFNTPVLGLYAASNSKRSGPYLSQHYCIDKYEEAAQIFKKKSSSELKWGTKLEYDGVMDLIQVEEVKNKLKEIIT